MTRLAATLLLGTLALAPAAPRAGDTFACKDADGNWVFGNVEQHRCVGKVKHVSARSAGSYRRGTSAAEAKAILLAPSAYREHVQRAADKYNLSVELLHAVMAVESGFRPDAVSVKGAVGLMQLMPETARDMYVRDRWSPEENIEGGARYLRVLANQYQGDLEKTLAAYNAGPEAVKRAGGIPRIPETQDYVRRVLDIYQKLKSMNAKG
jgi:soluble lytic murein transglycosylase-like protein